MSAYSTIRVTRDKAKAVLVNFVMFGATNEELEGVLDKFILQDKVLNCRIVGEDEENDNYCLD